MIKCAWNSVVQSGTSPLWTSLESQRCPEPIKDMARTGSVLIQVVFLLQGSLMERILLLLCKYHRTLLIKYSIHV